MRVTQINLSLFAGKSGELSRFDGNAKRMKTARPKIHLFQDNSCNAFKSV
jgi:hypothetical protein